MLFCQYSSMPVKSTEGVPQVNPCVCLIRSAFHFPHHCLRVAQNILTHWGESVWCLWSVWNHPVYEYVRVCVCVCLCVKPSNQSVCPISSNLSVSVNLQPVNQSVQYFCSERCAPSSQWPPISRHFEDFLFCVKYEEVRSAEFPPLLLRKTLT